MIKKKIKEIKIEVYGRVQGVNFRHFILKNALKLNLKGFVRNLKNGNVLILAQGKKEDLDNFLEIVQKGPFLSNVEGLSFLWKEFSEKYKDFEISTEDTFLVDQKKSFFNLGKKILGGKAGIPSHVAIIPDGNRRWAKERGLLAEDGHLKGGSYNNLKGLFSEAKNLGVKYLTFWAFSTENWKRSSEEANKIFDIILKSCKKFRKEASENKIRFRHIGRKDRLPKKLINELEKLEGETKEFKEFNVQLCLDYGGRDEIMRAVNKIIKAGVRVIKEEEITNYLDTIEIPDPDLIIRTSGENRLSGFMPYQSTYSEFYFANIYFPDFTPKKFRKVLEDYSERKRTFGK
jgi:undecaprenyl diphosphate synthase